MTDETNKMFTPPRPAIPVSRTKQDERVADAIAERGASTNEAIEYLKKADTKQDERVVEAMVGAIAKCSTTAATPADIIRGRMLVERSLRAKKAWQTRRANATVKSTPKPKHDLAAQVRRFGADSLLPPDRHRPGDVEFKGTNKPTLFTAKEAVELARLMVDYPFLRRLVE